MKIHWYGWLTLLAILALVLDAYAFAGLRRVPGVGDAVAARARLESPLMDTYLVAGSFALRYTPFMQGFSDNLASATWGDAYAAVRKHPRMALYMLGTESRGVVHVLMEPVYWAPLLLFPIALVGWYFRPRKVSLIRSGG